MTKKTKEQVITDAVGALGCATNPGLRQLSLAALLDIADPVVPDDAWVNPKTLGADIIILGETPTVVEIKRSGKKSKPFGAHTINVETIQRLGPRTADPDAEQWYGYVQEWLGYLREPLRTWHAWSATCTDDSDNSCHLWGHSTHGKRVCVGMPQPPVYLYCNYPSAQAQTVTNESRLVVLGGAADTPWAFYDAYQEDFGHNPDRFSITSHAAYLNRLANGLNDLSLSPSDRELVHDTATAMWCDMTWAEAETLDPAAHNLVAIPALDHWRCDCLPCLERRDATRSCT